VKLTIEPETADDHVWIRDRATQPLGPVATNEDEMSAAVTVACRDWVRDHPDLMSLKAGSIVRVPSGILYAVQSDGRWLRLANHGTTVEATFISPQHAEWTDAEIIWSAS
jgi:hypothetical protein